MIIVLEFPPKESWKHVNINQKINGTNIGRVIYVLSTIDKNCSFLGFTLVSEFKRSQQSHTARKSRLLKENKDQLPCCRNSPHYSKAAYMCHIAIIKNRKSMDIMKAKDINYLK